MEVITIRVTKGMGKGDTASYSSRNRKEILQILPKQGILPQPLVNYVVEKLFQIHGPIRAIMEGEATVFSSVQEEEAQKAEALIEVFASELWSTNVKEHEFLAMVALICDNHNIARFVPTLQQIEAGRLLLRDLAEKWTDLPPGKTLEVIL